jgi:proton glutamate symport protein
VKRWYTSSTSLIFGGLALGIVAGGLLPEESNEGSLLQFVHGAFGFLSDAFIHLIKGLIVPLIFSTIVVGVAQTADMKTVGRMGGKALLYFEVVTTIALFLGWAVATLVRPGDGLPLDLSKTIDLDMSKRQTGWAIPLHAIPTNLVEHAAKNDILPVVVFATLFGVALTRIGARGKSVLAFFDATAQTMFKYTDFVMKLAPLGVFGAIAASVRKMAAGYTLDGVTVVGWPAVAILLRKYAVLVGSLYLALLLLFGLVFVPIMILTGTNVLRFFRHVRDPVLTAFSTASSEAALPKLLEKLVEFGVPRRVAGFVVPAGYSFNLDGSTLYLVLATLTIAQASGTELSLGEELVMLFTLMLTSKGVAGVPRATLLIIAATCASFGLPGPAGVAMLLAVDAIMDMARSAVNVTGNGLASVVVAKWEGVFGTETAPVVRDEALPIAREPPRANADTGPTP